MNNHEKIKRAFGDMKAPGDMTDRILQSEERKTPVRIRRPLAVAAVIAAVVSLSAAAYAVASIAFNRTESVPANVADAGGSQVIVPMDEETKQAYQAASVGNTSHNIYVKNPDTKQNVNKIFDSDTANVLRGLLEGKVFAKDGEPFDFVAYLLKNNNLLEPYPDIYIYSADGEEIRQIVYWAKEPFGTPTAVSFSFEDLIMPDYADTYESAAVKLGKEFRLPDVTYIEEYDFKYEADFNPHGNMKVWISIRHAKGGAAFSVAVENSRDDGTEPDYLQAPVVIEDFEIDGIVIHKVTLDSGFKEYMWEHDSLSYMLMQYPDVCGTVTFCPTDEQCEEIIWSMIR